MTWKCTTCGAENEEAAAVCSVCRCRFEPAMAAPPSRLSAMWTRKLAVETSQSQQLSRPKIRKVDLVLLGVLPFILCLIVVVFVGTHDEGKAFRTGLCVTVSGGYLLLLLPLAIVRAFMGFLRSRSLLKTAVLLVTFFNPFVLMFMAIIFISACVNWPYLTLNSRLMAKMKSADPKALMDACVFLARNRDRFPEKEYDCSPLSGIPSAITNLDPILVRFDAPRLGHYPNIEIVMCRLGWCFSQQDDGRWQFCSYDEASSKVLFSNIVI